MIEDPRGTGIVLSTHNVKTLGKAQEWYGESKEEDLPLRVEQATTVDGRVAVDIYNKDKKLIHRRG